MTAGDVKRAYEAYDGFVGANGSPEAALLEAIALFELRAIATQAVDDPRLQTEALERLGRHGDARSRDDLQRMALDAQTGPAAALAYGALARLGDNGALMALAAMAANPSVRDKTVVAEAIRRTNSVALAPVVVSLLQDPNWATRAEAAETLGALGHRASAASIRALLPDAHPFVRAKAAEALRRLGDASAPVSGAGAQGSGGSAHLEALRTDRAAGRAAIAGAAKPLLNDPDPLIRVQAADAIGGFDPSAAHAALRKVAEDPDPTARRLAARTLETLEPTDVPLLRRLLEDVSGWVRVYAAGGILVAARRQ